MKRAISWDDLETSNQDLSVGFETRVEQYLRALRKCDGNAAQAMRSLGMPVGNLSTWHRLCPGLRREEQLIIDDCEVQRAAAQQIEPRWNDQPGTVRVIELYNDGLRPAEIAREVGLSRQCVTEKIRRLKTRTKTTPQKVADALEWGPLTTEELVEETRSPRPLVSQALTGLRARGVIALDEGVWAIVDEETGEEQPCSQE